MTHSLARPPTRQLATLATLATFATLALLAAIIACNPTVPLPDGPAAGAGASSASKTKTTASGSGGAQSSSAVAGGTSGLAAALGPPVFTVTTDPSAALDAAPTVLWLLLAAPGVAVDPTRVTLVEGALTPTQLREIQRGAPSAALLKRLVDAKVWLDVGTFSGGVGSPLSPAAVLVPNAPLVPGATYSLASTTPNGMVTLNVATEDTAVFLPRVWPLLGQSATARLGVWCGDSLLPAIDQPATLAPDGPGGHLRRGITAGDLGQHCLRFEATAADPASGEGTVPPPDVEAQTAVFRLDPRPFTAGAPAAAPVPVACGGGEVAFGPGCVVVLDDRLYGRSPDAAVLWAVRGEGLDLDFATQGSEPFVVAHLPPSSAVNLTVLTLDNAGAAIASSFAATTLSAMPHVIVNEVLARPLGPKPSEEWVELVNDGPAAADLTGYTLLRPTGQTALPAAMLAPGEYALLANATFVGDDGVDPVVAPSAQILGVKKLGVVTSTTGVPLQLADANGTVVSWFPTAPKPAAGQSLARRRPEAPDALASSYAVARPTPGSANGL